MSERITDLEAALLAKDAILRDLRHILEDHLNPGGIWASPWCAAMKRIDAALSPNAGATVRELIEAAVDLYKDPYIQEAYTKVPTRLDPVRLVRFRDAVAAFQKEQGSAQSS
jgi:hypothetical protein